MYSCTEAELDSGFAILFNIALSSALNLTGGSSPPLANCRKCHFASAACNQLTSVDTALYSVNRARRIALVMVASGLAVKRLFALCT